MKVKTSHIKISSKMFFLRGLLPVLFLMFLYQAAAQNQEVTIIAPYQPTLSAAQKLTLNPVLTDTLVNIPNVSYAITSSPVFTGYTTEKVKPALIDVETGETLRRNYLKAGFGNYTTPYVELYTNNLRSKQYALGFYARHHSSQGEIKDYAKSAFSKNDVGLNYKRYLNEKIFSGNLIYNRNVVHYYGFNPDSLSNDTIADDALRQRYSLFGFNTTLASNHRPGFKTNYNAGLRFYHLSDLYETSEMNIGVTSNINTQNVLSHWADSRELGADFVFDFYQNSDSLRNEGTIALTLKPYLNLNFGYLDLTLGASLALASDSASDFFVYPHVKASYEVIPGNLRFYISASGGLHRNSYKNIVGQNPWAGSIFPYGFTSTKYDLKGGATGKLNMLVDYNFNVSYAEIENMLFFVNDYFSPYSTEITENLGNKFTGLYDNAKVTAISLEIGYRQSKFFNAQIKGIYRNYELETQEHPWHKPALEIVLNGKYLLRENITIGGEIFYNSKTFAPVLDAGTIIATENKGFVDLNLNAEYRFNEQISAFAQINNATATRYYRFYNYPSQRIMAMGGFIFSF